MAGRDAQRIREDLAGAKRPDRQRNLSSAYLQQSVEALHKAGDPDFLFRNWRGRMPPEPLGRQFIRGWGRDERFRQSCNCVIFSAFAAESFVNEFLAATSSKVAKRADRWPPIRKLREGVEAAYGEPLFGEGDEGATALEDLFWLRNRLAHPKPGLGSPGLFDPDDEQLQSMFAMSQLAEFVVMTAGAADALIWRAYGRGHLDHAATKLWRGRDAIRAFAERRAELPDPGDKGEPDLWVQIDELFAKRESLTAEPRSN